MLADLPRPIIFAHRGASRHAPENTLSAFRLAIEHGARAIELDVKLSADEQVIVIHDQTVTRTTGAPGSVEALTLAELRRLEAGSSFSDAYQGERIPTLQEVFELCAGQVFINIELTNYQTPDDSLPERVAELVAAAGMQETVLFSSFNPLTLLRAHRLLPEVPLGLLALTGELGRRAYDLFFASDSPYMALHPAYEEVTLEMVTQVHALQRLVNTYTVNEPADLRRLARMGVDGFFTDDPRLAQQVLYGESPP